MGKHYSAEQWAVWVVEQRDSELSVAEFCEWIGVSLNSFYRWRQKLAAEDRLPTRDGLARERQVASDETRRPLAWKATNDESKAVNKATTTMCCVPD